MDVAFAFLDTKTNPAIYCMGIACVLRGRFKSSPRIRERGEREREESTNEYMKS